MVGFAGQTLVSKQQRTNSKRHWKIRMKSFVLQSLLDVGSGRRGQEKASKKKTQTSFGRGKINISGGI
jgi:hypothetical protein